jgi:hypothetical protein
MKAAFNGARDGKKHIAQAVLQVTASLRALCDQRTSPLRLHDVAQGSRCGFAAACWPCVRMMLQCVRLASSICRSS